MRLPKAYHVVDEPAVSVSATPSDQAGVNGGDVVDVQGFVETGIHIMQVHAGVQSSTWTVQDQSCSLIARGQTTDASSPFVACLLVRQLNESSSVCEVHSDFR